MQNTPDCPALTSSPIRYRNRHKLSFLKTIIQLGSILNHADSHAL